MPYWPPDTPPVTPPQMPAAPNSGPAPVPFGGDQGAGNPDWLPASVDPSTPGPGVMSSVTGANHVSEAPLSAPNVNPYYTGAISPIQVHGDPDAGGHDVVSSTVAGAVAAREAFYMNQEADTHPQGSNLGGLMNFAQATATGANLDPGIAPGVTEPAAGFYDPPRNYGDA